MKPRREAEQKKQTHMRGGSGTKGEKHQLTAPAEKVFARKRKYIFLPRVSGDNKEAEIKRTANMTECTE